MSGINIVHYIRFIVDGEIIRINDTAMLKVAEKLERYEDLEEQELLIKLDLNQYKRDDLDRCTHRHCNNCDKYRRELQRYKDLEEQGRLMELPCAVGDTVYLIEEGCEDIYLPSTNYYYIEENPFDVWMLCGVGKTVFLTEEEAEKKLQELQENE